MRRRQVKKTLGLPDIAKGLTKVKRIEAHEDRIHYLETLLKKADLTKIMAQRAEEYIRKSHFVIRQLKNVSTKEAKRMKAFNANQMMLPNFLKGLSMVRIEELVAERLAEKLVNKKLAKAFPGKSRKSA